MYTLPNGSIAGAPPILATFPYVDKNSTVRWMNLLNELNGTRFSNRNRGEAFQCTTSKCYCRLAVLVLLGGVAEVEIRGSHVEGGVCRSEGKSTL